MQVKIIFWKIFSKRLVFTIILNVSVLKTIKGSILVRYILKRAIQTYIEMFKVEKLPLDKLIS